MALFIEQCLNGLQFGLLLFLMASGLTLIFGIMGQINLAHGSLFMLGAYFSVTFERLLGSMAAGILLALVASFAVGIALEVLVFRRLYTRDHLLQVIATFGLILIFDEIARMIWGVAPVFAPIPSALAGAVKLGPLPYPAYRLTIIAAGLATAAALFLVIQRTRLGALIRAGAEDRAMVAHLGVNIAVLYTIVFGLGATLAGFAGIMAAPVTSVRPGMGEEILILTFVVIVVGGLGSVQGAFLGALLIGIGDTLGRAYIGGILAAVWPSIGASGVASSVSSTLVFLIMAVVLVLKPGGLLARRER
jgi:branched-subunit amino acid ABC-type transport system permease component